jgi:hypothetical protein
VQQLLDHQRLLSSVEFHQSESNLEKEIRKKRQEIKFESLPAPSICFHNDRLHDSDLLEPFPLFFTPSVATCKIFQRNRNENQND